MKKKKARLLSWLLVCILAVSMTSMTAFARETQGRKEKTVSAEKIREITISNIISSLLDGGFDQSAIKISLDGVPSEIFEIIDVEWTSPNEVVIHGEDLDVQGGTYNFRLVIRSNGTMTFDNDLDVYYQGINGKYQLNYEIDETDDHIMIVTGTFDNIFIKSPLLEKLSDESKNWILSHFSEDNYFYQLTLKTAEGFSFTNMLKYLYDAKEYGYSIDYVYDLLTKGNTLAINWIITDGWLSIGEKYIYIENGLPVTGWKKIGKRWYLFDDKGVMQTGWQQYDGKWYFLKSSGAMAAGEYVQGYWLNKDGSWTYEPKASWHKDKTGWWYGDTAGWYAKNMTITIDGVKYSFDAKGYLK